MPTLTIESCGECGVWVADWDLHNKWHNRMLDYVPSEVGEMEPVGEVPNVAPETFATKPDPATLPGQPRRAVGRIGINVARAIPAPFKFHYALGHA